MQNRIQVKKAEANFWDAVADERVYAAFSEKEYNLIFNRYLQSKNNGKALDIGCASGVSTVILARRGFQAMGVDISAKLISQATRLWKDEKNPPKFLIGDAENLDVPTGSIDLCFLGGVIHHFPDKQKILRELSRVIKKGGILLMLEPNYLDVIERISWFFAEKLKILSPNEYPVSPIEIKNKLQAEFTDFEMYPIRTDDIPFFSFIPILGERFFRGGKGKLIKMMPLTLLNLFRPYLLQRGNFFVLYCVKM